MKPTCVSSEVMSVNKRGNFIRRYYLRRRISIGNTLKNQFYTNNEQTFNLYRPVDTQRPHYNYLTVTDVYRNNWSLLWKSHEIHENTVKTLSS